MRAMWTRIQRFYMRHPNWTLWLAVCTIAVYNALSRGPDFFWDTLNYHIYTPFAALNGRLETDIAPAGIHSYFSPTADFFHYICLRLLAGWPKLLQVTQSVWYALTLFFTLKILRLCLPRGPRVFPAALTALLFFFAPAIYIWSAFNTADMLSAAPLAASLYLTLSSCTLADGKQKTVRFIGAGILYGLTFALKYTTAPFLAAYVVMFCFCFSSFKQWLKYGLWFTAGATGAFLLAGGWWCWKMYQTFGNPFFPFYNNIFHSPYFDPVALVDYRFFTGKKWWEFLLLPFTFLQRSPMNTTELFMRGAGWLAYWAGGTCLLVRANTSRVKRLADVDFVKRLFVFFAAGYVLWLAQFSLLRYTMPLEMAGVILFSCALQTLVRGKRRFFIMGMLCGLICFYNDTLNYHEPFPKRMDNILSARSTPDKTPSMYRTGPLPVKKDSVVILQGWKLSYLIPMISPRARYVGGLQADYRDYPDLISRLEILNMFSFSPVFYRHRFAPQIYRAIDQASHVYVLLPTYSPKVFFRRPLKHYGVQIRQENCTWIVTHWDYPSLLCEADKL